MSIRPFRIHGIAPNVSCNMLFGRAATPVLDALLGSHGVQGGPPSWFTPSPTPGMGWQLSSELNFIQRNRSGCSRTLTITIDLATASHHRNVATWQQQHSQDIDCNTVAYRKRKGKGKGKRKGETEKSKQKESRNRSPMQFVQLAFRRPCQASPSLWCPDCLKLSDGACHRSK